MTIMKTNDLLLMKTPGVRRCVIGWLGVAILAITVSAADETVVIDFRNRIPGVLDAPVYDADGVTPLAGPLFFAQLWGSNEGPDALVPLGTRTPFQSGPNAGYWEPTTVDLGILGAKVGQQIWLQVQAFELVQTGPVDFGRALVGRGAIVQVTLTNSVMPFVGWQSFSLTPERLDFERRGEEMVIRWENQNAYRYVLESATTLVPPVNWSSAYQPNLNTIQFGETIAFTNATAAAQSFYRLKRYRQPISGIAR